MNRMRWQFNFMTPLKSIIIEDIPIVIWWKCIVFCRAIAVCIDANKMLIFSHFEWLMNAKWNAIEGNFSVIFVGSPRRPLPLPSIHLCEPMRFKKWFIEWEIYRIELCWAQLKYRRRIEISIDWQSVGWRWAAMRAKRPLSGTPTNYQFVIFRFC